MRGARDLALNALTVDDIQGRYDVLKDQGGLLAAVEHDGVDLAIDVARIGGLGSPEEDVERGVVPVSRSEIAEVLEVSVPRVHQLRAKALKDLRKILEAG